MRLNKKGFLSGILLCAATLAAGAATIKSGDSVAFLGDSITDQGHRVKYGYVRICELAFKANGLDVKIIPAGVSGHKSNEMLARLKRDVLDKKPTWLTISCGVNDVWHFKNRNGVPLPEYKKNIGEIVDRAQAAGIKVIILTSTMIEEDVNNARNKMLAGYNEFLREFAKVKNCKLADLSAEMIKIVTERRAEAKADEKGRYGNFLTVDGIHMNFFGNRMMAMSILKNGFEFTDAELAKSEEALGNLVDVLPYFVRQVSPWEQAEITVTLTGEEFMRLNEVLMKDDSSAEEFLRTNLRKDVLAPFFDSTGQEWVNKQLGK